MLRRYIVLGIVIVWCAQAGAQQTLVVDLKTERSDGTPIEGAEVSVYRQSTRKVDVKTDANGHAKVSLPEGDPVDLKVEYRREPNTKYWPYTIRFLSGRKQTADGQIPVVLFKSTETRTKPAYSAAIGDIENAYRLVGRSREFERQSDAYEQYLDELVRISQQEPIQAAIGDDADDQYVFDNKLNTLATQFLRELPVVSSGAMVFPVVKGTDEQPVNFIPELGSYCLVIPSQGVFWKSGRTGKAKTFANDANVLNPGRRQAAIAMDDLPLVFLLHNGRVEATDLVKDLKTTENIEFDRFAKALFVAPNGKTLATVNPQGSVLFHTKDDGRWTNTNESAGAALFDGATFSVDGTKFATWSGTFVNGRILVYDTRKGRNPATVRVPEGVSGLAFDASANGLYVSSRARHLIRKYNLDEQKFQTHQASVGQLLGPLGWDPIENRLYVPMVTGDIKTISGF